MALAALVVCAAAFLLGLIPVLGVVLGVVGIVLVVVVACRGLATRRTYVGAGAAALGILVSAATNLALIGLALYPTGSRKPEPTVAAEESEPAEEATEPVVAKEETTEEHAPTTEPDNTTEPVPTGEPSAAPATGRRSQQLRGAR